MKFASAALLTLLEATITASFGDDEDNLRRRRQDREKSGRETPALGRQLRNVPLQDEKDKKTTGKDLIEGNNGAGTEAEALAAAAAAIHHNHLARAPHEDARALGAPEERQDQGQDQDGPADVGILTTTEAASSGVVVDEAGPSAQGRDLSDPALNQTNLTSAALNHTGEAVQLFRAEVVEDEFPPVIFDNIMGSRAKGTKGCKGVKGGGPHDYDYDYCYYYYYYYRAKGTKGCKGVKGGGPQDYDYDYCYDYDYD